MILSNETQEMTKTIIFEGFVDDCLSLTPTNWQCRVPSALKAKWILEAIPDTISIVMTRKYVRDKRSPKAKDENVSRFIDPIWSIVFA